MTDRLTIVKVGGAIVEDARSLAAFLDRFAALDGFTLLVHGGGRSATALASSMGIDTVMVGGRRVTDEAMLRVVTMVYGGLVNKNIVAGLQARGVDALGVTGADMDMIRSRRRQVTAEGVDYGYVGDVERVNADAFASLLRAGVVPVVAPLTHDGLGSMLNTNADTMASAVATALAPVFDVTLMYCFEKPGVLADSADDKSVIPVIDHAGFNDLKSRGVITGGMLPKIENALAAVEAGVTEVVITSAESLGGGTLIRS
ncbi:MAG: acetylglutamate kinase [Muribaculaceae bacterium]|nr:acetylglutamate kinase [Muribaculaceae bacterium]